MTRFELLRLLVRRWYVLLLVAVLTAFGTLMVQSPVPVYSTEVNVMFLPPDGVLMDQAESLIDFAAVVERQFNRGDAPLKLSSNVATLYGAGLREGYSVSLYDTGGQWQTNFSRPVLQVEVVGSGETEVRAELVRLLARIDAVSLQTQKAAGVKSSQLIRSNVSPTPAVVVEVRGNRWRATAGIVALGLGIAVGASCFVDRIIARRRRLRVGPTAAATDTARAR